MKKIAFFAAAVLMLSLTACSSDKDGFDETDEEEDNQEWPMDTYRGTLIVDQNDGTVYTQKNVVLHVTMQQGSVEIEMKNVGFSDRMPVKLDMTIQDVTAKENDGVFDISGDGLIPYALGGEFEEYTITAMQGELCERRIDFQMMCGPYPLAFTGIHEDLPVKTEISYMGTLRVDQNDGTVYTQEDVRIEVSLDSQADQADILMNGVSFSDRMPIKLNMTIPGLSAPAAYGGYRLTGENIIPHALGGEYEMYTITGFTGNISELKEAGIQFEMMCGTYPTSFTGKRIDK